MKSRTASVPGWWVEFQANVLRQLPRPEELDQTTAEGWNRNQKALKKILAQALLPPVQSTYKVVVDDSTLAEMIEAGKYDQVNDDITDEHFPIQGAGQHEMELVLVHLNQTATTKEVLERLNSQGLEPAKIEYLLSFGVTYPELQREFSIIALGSVWVHSNGNRCPYLDGRGGQRALDIHWVDDNDQWAGHCRFLAVRKQGS